MRGKSVLDKEGGGGKGGMEDRGEEEKEITSIAKD